MIADIDTDTSGRLLAITQFVKRTRRWLVRGKELFARMDKEAKGKLGVKKLGGQVLGTSANDPVHLNTSKSKRQDTDNRECAKYR